MRFFKTREYGPPAESAQPRARRANPSRGSHRLEASAAAGRAGSGFLRWNTAGALFPAASCFFTEDGYAAERMERLPGDSLRILDPVFVRLGVAARCPGLVERMDAGFRHLLAQIFQLLVRIHLKSQVVAPGRATASRNGNVDPRIPEHPLAVVVLHDGRRRAAEVAVETPALGQILDGNVNMESLHVTFSFRLRATGLYAGTQVSPPQQFSVK